MTNIPPQSSKKIPPKTKGGVDRRTTVLHMTPTLDPNAQARAVVDLALLTHRGGWRPLIASSGGSLVLEAERSAIRHTRMPLHKKNIFSSWRCRVQLEALNHSMRPDIVHAHGIRVLATACSFSAAHNIPLLVELNDPIDVTSRNRRLLRKAVAHGATFCVPSDFMANHLQQDLKLLSPSLYRVAPGVDTQWYDASRITAERVQSLASAWRLPETSTVILTATPVAYGQGHKLLLQTLAQLKRKDLFTVIIGPPINDFHVEVERAIKAYNLEGQVVMIDYCHDWPAACWLASVLVAANTVPRGQAQEILAAQSLGRPVITTDCGANAAFVQSGETAWLIPTDDPRALATALTEATQMTMDQRLDLAERTRTFILNNFTQTAWSSSIFELYTAMTAAPIKS